MSCIKVLDLQEFLDAEIDNFSVSSDFALIKLSLRLNGCSNCDVKGQVLLRILIQCLIMNQVLEKLLIDVTSKFHTCWSANYVI